MDRLRRVVLMYDRFGNHSFVVCGDGAQSLHGTTQRMRWSHPPASGPGCQSVSGSLISHRECGIGEWRMSRLKKKKTTAKRHVVYMPYQQQPWRWLITNVSPPIEICALGRASPTQSSPCCGLKPLLCPSLIIRLKWPTWILHFSDFRYFSLIS